MPHDKDDERPKKSWREIDAAREKGQSRRPDNDNSAKRSTSQAYRSYKSQLNKLFDGGALPAALQAKLGATEVASNGPSRQAMAQHIVAATTPQAMKAALRAYIEAFEFPQDEAVLTKVLDLDDAPWVLQAIAALDALWTTGALKRGAALRGRLKTVQLTMDDPAVRDAAGQLVAKL